MPAAFPGAGLVSGFGRQGVDAVEARAGDLLQAPWVRVVAPGDGKKRGGNGQTDTLRVDAFAAEDAGRLLWNLHARRVTQPYVAFPSHARSDQQWRAANLDSSSALGRKTHPRAIELPVVREFIAPPRDDP
jgi:hypothetical protein